MQMLKSTHIRGLAIGAIAYAVFLGACSSKQEGEPAPVATVQVAAAQTQPIQQVVSADAVLYPIDQAAIVPQVSAPIKKFYVQRGSQVHAGQLLAELESQPLQGAVTENQGNYQQAQAAYQTALQNAQQQLTLAKQQLDAAQKVYDGRQNLLKQGAVSQKDAEDARIALTQAQNQYDSAQKQYDLKAAEGQLNAAKGRVTSAQAQLDYARITSPIAGIVTDRPYFAGETVPSGQPIATVMNLSSIVARAHIAQDQASHLKVGDTATISSTGTTKPLEGKVTLVSPALDPSSTTVEVWVQAANPGDRLKPGANARVSIVAQTIQNAIVIPSAALLTETNGSTSVMVIGADNKPKQQDVKVGIRNGDNAQITDGLKPGDRVATTGAYELSTEDPDVLAKTTVQIAKPAPTEDDSN
ncbi:MAG TPA: efflux RND transporter periplasmic adaptor subunit [Candidatus Acidoferrales bacterium]|nr:efflux RND transporter periplasmic adaptor subunit [Candidatus Acidoferrales bacterium]